MKIIRFLILAICLGMALPFYSQNKNMVDSLTTTKKGGEVTIHQDQGITNLLGNINTTNAPLKQKKASNRGYRIQAYSGSQQKIAKTEVYNRESRFRSRLPQYSTYVTFNSPFWKLRVGDFADHAAAQEAMNAIKRAFPEYSGELYIVSDNVRISE